MPFCSNTLPFHSLRKTMGVPTCHVVSRSEPYCHRLTRSGVVRANHTSDAGARISTVDSDIFTGSTPFPSFYGVAGRLLASGDSGIPLRSVTARAASHSAQIHAE